ncbi:MAG: menaquinone biosynthesis protein [Verrucomicrobiota bacterium]|nr:menaquinone biosynthesis protein [Verrucomicrobiota bacterium]
MTSAVSGLNIGCVKYLNARPLIEGCGCAMRFDHPAALARDLSRGALDVALVPSYELFRNSGYKIVDGVSISSEGEVRSVFVAYRGELARVRQISLDPASLTSTHLLKCLLAEFHQIDPEFLHEGGDAKLLIGNQALQFRREQGTKFEYFDLGAEWTARTGLPFVYALWLVRDSVENASAVADALRSAKIVGSKHIAQISEQQTVLPPADCVEYLTRNIHYDLRVGEKRGLEKFHELSVKHGFLKKARFSPTYV